MPKLIALLTAVVLATGTLPGDASACHRRPLLIFSPALTPEIARQALLDMMRSREGQKFGWFQEGVPDKMAPMAISDAEDGWYLWSAYQFSPSRAQYHLIIAPKAGSEACTFFYEGSFQLHGERWEATLPKLSDSAHEFMNP